MRGNKLGLKMEEYKKEGRIIPNELIIEMLRPVFFKEQKNKYILQNYPNSVKEVFYIIIL
jgi:adenylate kinase family enzyme